MPHLLCFTNVLIFKIYFKDSGKHNVSFLSYFLLGQLEKCLEILVAAGRIPEAAFFARTYLPSQVSRVVALWRVQLGKVSEKAGQSLADPGEYPNLFPDFQASLEAEARLRKEREQTIPAGDFQEIVVSVCGGGGDERFCGAGFFCRSRFFLP